MSKEGCRDPKEKKKKKKSQRKGRWGTKREGKKKEKKKREGETLRMWFKVENEKFKEGCGVSKKKKKKKSVQENECERRQAYAIKECNPKGLGDVCL